MQSNPPSLQSRQSVIVVAIHYFNVFWKHSPKTNNFKKNNQPALQSATHVKPLALNFSESIQYMH